MVRTVLSVIAGIVAWVVVATAINYAMRHAWPDYAAVEKAMDFTLPMMLARLTESTVALVVAAVVTARIAPASRYAPWALGVVMLLCFIPVHYSLWTKFPIWYHAYFLSSLIVVPVIAGRLAQPKS
jgi:hypothetical protein